MTAVDGFLRSCERFPRRPAVEVAGQTLSYAELYDRAASIAATLSLHAPGDDPPLTAVFAERTPTAFAGVLAAMLRGHGYLPLSRRHPVARTRGTLLRSGARALVADAESAERLVELLAPVPEPLFVVLPDLDDARTLADALPLHRFVTRRELAGADGLEPAAIGGDDVAYVLFTSGSTGTPKGVVVAHRNVSAFVADAVERFGVTEDDRFSQLSDLTFDLSVSEVFVAWARGACLCCPDEATRFRPARFVDDSRLTVWISVPSVALFMQRLGMLKPGRYPLLRAAAFCGEPLLLDIARAWRLAVPNAALHNLYGPTELTVACTAYAWDDERSPGECDQGVVPIGDPLPGMEALVVDEELVEVPPGADGELLMTGPQLTLGYWRDERQTAAAYVVPPGRDRIYYRTGDRVVRPTDGRPFLFRGRVDHQIKVLGHRVELGEIEAAVRDAAGVNAVVAVGWPMTAAGAAGIAAFVGAAGADPDLIRSRVASMLPEYMVPRRIEVVDVLPLNANGKFDRRALAQRLEVGG